MKIYQWTCPNAGCGRTFSSPDKEKVLETRIYHLAYCGTARMWSKYPDVKPVDTVDTIEIIH